MSELDLSGVDPLRRPEVRRRVGVITEFLNIAKPTKMDQAASAALLGLSVNQFMALVRAWRQHRSAAMIAGSGAHRRAKRQPSRLAVQKEAKDVAIAIIDEIGPDGPFVDIHHKVLARCEALGLFPPSRSTLWNMVMARRTHRQGDENRIVIGSCYVQLPVEVDGEVTMQSLTLAVRAGNGAVLAAALSPVSWSDFVAQTSLETASIQVDRTLLHEGDFQVLGNVYAVAKTVARSALARLLGAGIGPLRLIYQPSRAMTPKRLLRTRNDHPLSRQDLRDVVLAEVARHNEERQADPAMWIDATKISPAS